MASIYKRSGSAIYQCQFYVVHATTNELQKVRKSTGHTNGKKAMAFAVEMERNAQSVIQGGSDRAQRAKAVLAEAVAEIERETFTAPVARKYLAQLLAIATGEDMTDFTLETWIAEWLRRKARGTSDSTMARYKGHTTSFLTFLGDERRKKPLGSVTPQDARRWRESLQDDGRIGRTVQNYMKDIGAVYRAAIQEGLISFNPCTALEPLDTSDSMERKPFTLAEIGSLIKASPNGQWSGLILVAAFTGLRLGDAARLKWETVDLDDKRIVLMPRKTQKKKRTIRIPIQSDLLKFLISVRPQCDQPYVFTALSKANGEKYTAALSKVFNKIMLAAKVDRGKASHLPVEGEKSKGRVTYERGFHSLRHTFTSWLRNAGVSEEDRMALTGHSTRESHQIYSHANDSALDNAIAKLPNLS